MLSWAYEQGCLSRNLTFCQTCVYIHIYNFFLFHVVVQLLTYNFGSIFNLLAFQGYSDFKKQLGSGGVLIQGHFASHVS